MMGVWVLSVVLLLVTSTTGSTLETSPLFMWSNYRYFTEQRSQHQILTPVDTLRQSLSHGLLHKYVAPQAESPEAIVVFLQPHLKTEEFFSLSAARTPSSSGGVFSSLKAMVEESSSSLTIPFVQPVNGDNVIGSLIASQMATQVEGDVYVISSVDNSVNIEGAKRITLDQLKTMERIGSSTDLFVVVMNGREGDQSSLREDDAILRQVCESLKTRKFIGLFTAEKATLPNIHKRFPQQHDNYEFISKRYAQPDEVLGANIWNDSIVTALVVMIPFILILFIGLKCGFAIQSDVKFESNASSKKNL